MSRAVDHLLAEMRACLKCAVCQRRVAYVSRRANLYDCTETFVVGCHGAEESTTVPSEVVEAMNILSLGEAFAFKALPEPPRALEALP